VELGREARPPARAAGTFSHRDHAGMLGTDGLSNPQPYAFSFTAEPGAQMRDEVRGRERQQGAEGASLTVSSHRSPGVHPQDHLEVGRKKLMPWTPW
jgi:hypothetical protein